MNKVYAIGIVALIAIVICGGNIELVTAQCFSAVNNKSQEQIKEGVSIAEHNNFVDPVMEKVNEMKAKGLNNSEIIDALGKQGMGYSPETGATWMGSKPTPEELHNLPPRKYSFTDVPTSRLTTAAEADEYPECQLMGTGTENPRYNGFCNYMMPGSLAVKEDESYYHLTTTHLGRGGYWTEVGVVRSVDDPSYRIFTYDNDEGEYAYHGTINQSAYTQYQILVSDIYELSGWRYNILINGSWVRSGHLPFYANGVDHANEVWSDTNVWTRDTVPAVHKDPLLYVGTTSTVWWNQSIHTEWDWSYYITCPVKQRHYLSDSAWRYETWVNQFPIHNLNTGEDFSTIQEAIDDPDTWAGHTITIDQGTYYGSKADFTGRGVENVDVYKQLTIKSTSGNPENTIVKAVNSSNPVFKVTADYVNISGFTVTGGDRGICFSNVNESCISNIKASKNNFSIYLYHSNNGTLTNLDITNNDHDFVLYGANHNAITNITVNNDSILLFFDSNNNTLARINSSNNSDSAFFIYRSNNNEITKSNVFNNNQGITSLLSLNNKIYLNNFMNNTDNVYSTDSTNIWNSTKKITYVHNGSIYTNYLGNYWDDYKEKYPYAQEIDSTDIWNMPYAIESTADNYPLIEQWANFNKATALTVHNTDTGKSFSTIQDAIDDYDTKAGHTVTVDSGTYNENVNVTKRLTLKGIDTGGCKPVVDASGSGSAITLSADGITLEGFKATDSGSWSNAGIEVISNHNAVRNNNASNNGVGIVLLNTSNNTITRNTASNNDGGILLMNSSNNNTITRNTVSSNDLVGIFHWDSSNNQIYLNNFMNNTDNVYSMDSTNIWTSTKKITYTYSGSTYKNYLGNYWDDYEDKYPYAQEIDSTGIWNIPYAIESTADNYPLIEQWEKYNKSTALTVHNTDTGKSYSTIQAAIGDYDTKAGHTITVDSEAYFENVNVTKRLTLKGIDTGSGKPVVDASGSGSAITLSADGITLEGFKATGGSWDAAGIKVISSHNTIRNNNVSNNYGRGINLDYSGNIISGNNISNNTVAGNIVSSNGNEGIYLDFSSNNNIAGNTVNNNGEGINLDFSSNNNIAGNTVNNNGEGINLDFSSNNTITGNTFVNDGLNLYYSYQNTVKDNTVNGKPLVYLEDVSDTEVTDAGQVILVNCSNILVENLELSNTSVGVTLLKTDDSIVANNNICNNRYGIGLYDSRNNTISGNTVSNNDWEGILLEDSRNSTISGNTFVNDGLFVYYSYQNTVEGNTFVNDGLNVQDSCQNTVEGNTFVNGGLNVQDSYQNTVEGNTVNGKPLVYLEDTSDRAVTDAGQVILVNCSNITVDDLDLSNTNVGVTLWGAEDCKISNNTVSNSNYGLYFHSSCNNNITGNTVSNNNYAGIDFNWHSSNNNITGNTLNNGWGDINLWDSCSNNKIYLNNFMNNANNVYSYNSSNIWNSPEEITYTYDCSTYTNYLGNYWSDYNEKYPNAEEIDECGIWDTHYNLDSDNDTYPLVMPFVNYFASPPNGPFNIIQHQTTPVQIVLRGQDVQFPSGTAWTTTPPQVMRYESGDLSNTYTATVGDDGNYYIYNVNWPTTGAFYVGANPGDVQLSVLEPIMNLYSLKVNGVGLSSSIIQGTPLRIDFVTNLDANDLMDLEVLNPEGVILKTNPADRTQIFDNIKVCELLKYGSMNESKQINTTGWDIGTYTFCIRTETEHAQGLDMCSATRTLTVLPIENNFDTGPSENPYPSIIGTHNGTITPNRTIEVQTLYTYPCAGTGGHSEYAKICNDTWSIESEPWVGYQEDWHNLTFTKSFKLHANEEYNYTIRTGSYPQIHHTNNLSTPTGFITCSEFTDANGKRYTDRMPAIKLFI